MTDILDWTHRTIDLPERGLSRERAASPEMRARIATTLGLLSCDRLVLDYTLRPIAGDAVLMTGTLNGAITQACIVTLEPVPSMILEEISVEFHPASANADPPSGDAEVLSGPDIEPIDNGVIDVGRIAFETLSAALDPYPRKSDAAFNWSDPKASSDETQPFAVLKKLKKED